MCNKTAKIDGYKEASKIDFMINSLLSEHPINEGNVLEWMKYARTVQTTANVILLLTKNIVLNRDKFKGELMFEDL